MLMNPKKSVLLVIDVQAKLAPFIHDNAAVVDACVWLARVADRIGVPVVVTEHFPEKIGGTLDVVREHPVLERLPLGPKGRHAYFVHSYHLNATNEADVLARADYGGPVTAMVGKDTAIGTQFHPEKSQRFGLALIANFLKWKP